MKAAFDAFLAIVGGVRAAIFLGLAVLLAVAVGVQTWRLKSAETEIAKIGRINDTYQYAQDTNLDTITRLKKQISDMTATMRADEEAARNAGDRVIVLEAHLQTANTKNEALRNELAAKDELVRQYMGDAMPRELACGMWPSAAYCKNRRR